MVDRLVAQAGRRTLLKARVLCDDHLVVRFDQGTTAPVAEDTQQAILCGLEELFPWCDVVIVSDYGYGVAAPAVIDRLRSLQAASPRVLVVDAKSLAAYREVGMTACKPNFRQASCAAGPLNQRGGGTTHRFASAQRRGAARTDRQRHRGGDLGCRRGADFPARAASLPHLRPGGPTESSRGAGDTFLTTFAAALAVGLATPAAAELASAAAAVVVAKAHTATCTREELQEQLAGRQRPQDTLRRLLPILEEYRQKNRRIVLTSGCFDILHRGHVAYLAQARRLGDVLVVGVNTDDSIRRLKGPGRPINQLADRMGLLAALASVDHVVAFEEDTPHGLIQAVRPDVFVKGGDYSRATLPEADLVERLGGTVQIIPFAFDCSTTRIIKHICHAYGGRPETAASLKHGINHHENRGLAIGPVPAVR